MNETDTPEVLTAESGTLALLNKGEIDMQVATAHKYPRSIAGFLKEAKQMVTLTEKIAQECIYALPRDGKTIEGPSARFAEVIASAWGNSRAGARVVSDVGEFVTAQGVFHDLERNVAITYEVQRRITNKSGQRFKADMIGVTANAACSIALRNAILKGVPKAFWSDLYDAARSTAIGDSMTLANRRARALKDLQTFGVTPAMIFAYFKIGGEQDITLDHLSTLFGIRTALKEGDTTVEQAFAVDGVEPAAAPKPEVKTYPDDLFAKNLPAWRKLIDEQKKTADQIISVAQSKGSLTEAQKKALRGEAPAAAATDAPVFTYAQIADKINAAKTIDELNEAAALITSIAIGEQRGDLQVLYGQREEELTK
jgi:hypothetical protein